MLNDPRVVEAIRLLDQEISLRLRGTASESVLWAEKLYDVLSSLQECHRQTIEGVEDRFRQIGLTELDWGLRLYLQYRENAFSAILTDAFLALQIQDVTMQAIERACGAIERREAHLDQVLQSEMTSLADRLATFLREYVESDDLHRSSEEKAA